MNIQMIPSLKEEFAKLMDGKLFAFRPNNETLDQLKKNDVVIIAEYEPIDDSYTHRAIVRTVTSVDYTEDLNKYIGKPFSNRPRDYIAISFKKVPSNIGDKFIDHFCRIKDNVYDNAEKEKESNDP